MVDEFDQMVNAGKRRWLPRLLLNILVLAMLGLGAYVLLTRSGVITVQSIVASRTIRIGAEHRGKIKAIYVALNSEFKEGDPLFDLEDPLVESSIAETDKRIKEYDRDIAEQESELARRLREFDPKMKIETARQQIKEKQVALDSKRPLLDAANRRITLKEEALKKAEGLFASGVITRPRLDFYRLDYESEQTARDKILAEQDMLRTEIIGLQKQIASYGEMIADLTSSTAEQERTIREKQAVAKAELGKFLSEKAQLSCKAKISGSVAAVSKEEGEVVAPGDGVLTVTTGGDIWVEAYFKPEDVNPVQAGDELAVRYGLQTFPVMVESIGLITQPFPIQRATVMVQPERLVVVKLNFVHPTQAREAGLRPGMQVNTEMTRPEGLLYRLGLKQEAPRANDGRPRHTPPAAKRQ
jgi:multidrug resistance efflux pump